MPLTRLNKDEIYNLLDPSWWIDNSQFLDGSTFQSANIYFQDTIGNYHYYCSTGPSPENSNYSVDPTTRTYYIEYLMRDSANWLYNGQCSGNISNIEPKEYQPIPIYFK